MMQEALMRACDSPWRGRMPRAGNGGEGGELECAAGGRERNRRVWSEAGKPPGSRKLQLAFRCVDLSITRDDMDAFQSMLDRARKVGFRTFAARVEWRPLARAMGYTVHRGATGLRLSQDRAVRFYRSVFAGETVYVLNHSAIEFVFHANGNLQVSALRSPWS